MKRRRENDPRDYGYPTKTLLLKNLPRDLPSSDLAHLFKEYADIVNIRYNISKQLAFIDCKSITEAQRAIHAFNTLGNCRLKGFEAQKIKIEYGQTQSCFKTDEEKQVQQEIVNTNRELKKASLGGINEHMWADYLEACEELHTFNKEREQTEEALVASQQPEYEDPKNFLIPEALLPQAPGKRHKKAFVASQPSRNRSQLIQKEAEKMNFQPVPDQDGEILQNLDQRLHQLEVAGSSKKVPICYLCQRKFKSFDTLHQHEQYSVLHLANLAKGVQGS